MLPLHMGAPSGAPLSVLAIGAHPDDIEIGAAGCCSAWPRASRGFITRC